MTEFDVHCTKTTISRMVLRVEANNADEARRLVENDENPLATFEEVGPFDEGHSDLNIEVITYPDPEPMLKVGDKVWFRGKHARQFSIRGRVEFLPAFEEATERCVIGALGDYDEKCYGVRLENGNFHWARPNQLEPRTE